MIFIRFHILDKRPAMPGLPSRVDAKQSRSQGERGPRNFPSFLTNPDLSQA